MRRRTPFLLAVVLATCGASWAQQSASFSVRESAFNSGGRPLDGSTLASTSFRISLDALGDAFGAIGLAAPSFRSDAGLPVAYAPPGEVSGLVFTDDVTLAWTPERSAGVYEVYRGSGGDLPGLGYGTCLASELATAGTTDVIPPAAGSSFFYLITVRNRIAEEGTKGFRSSGAERTNPIPCP